MTEKDPILDYLIDNNLIPFTVCNEDELFYFHSLERQEEELPQNIYKRNLNLYVKISLTQKQIRQYIAVQQAKNIRTIKNFCIFFMAVTISMLTITFLHYISC